MSSSTVHSDVAAYAAAVRAELADLPPPDREALVEDLEDHLAEVAAESDAPLASRLGSPREYAAELRLAYGAGRGHHREPWGRLGRWRDGLTSSAAYAAVRAFLPELRPAWWVLRAYLAVLTAFLVLSTPQRVGLVPNPLTSRGLLQIVVTAAAVVLSVHLGRRAASASQAARWLGMTLNVLIGVAGLIALSTMGTGGSATAMYSYSARPYYAYGMYGGFAPVNIFAYAPDGRPLDGVLLYDQDGRPFALGGKSLDRLSEYPIGADGKPILNEYPRKQTYADGRPVPPPRVLLPAVTSTASPPPATSGSPSPSPTP
jgi:uncharacterized membrane protein